MAMRRSSSLESEHSEDSNLSEAFDAAAINATHRRSSTTQEHQEPSESDQTDEESANADGEPANPEEPDPVNAVEEPVNAEQEPVNPPANEQTRRRKQRTPLNRQQKLQREIHRLQMSPDFMIPRLRFGRLVRDIMNQCSSPVQMRITLTALEALQTASEMYMTQRFQDAYLLTMHRGRVTLEVRDFALMAFITQQMGKL